MSIPKLSHALEDIVSCHLGLNKSRIETLVVIIVGLVNGRTVNLSHIACHFVDEPNTPPTTAVCSGFFNTCGWTMTG